MAVKSAAFAVPAVLLPLSVFGAIWASLALVTAWLATAGFGIVPVRSPPIGPRLAAAAPEANFADVTTPTAIVAGSEPDPGPAVTSPVSWVIPEPGDATVAFSIAVGSLTVTSAAFATPLALFLLTIFALVCASSGLVTTLLAMVAICDPDPDPAVMPPS